MEIPITQSKMWENLQHALGEQSFFEETEAFLYLAILKSTPVGNYLYLPYGPVLKREKTAQADFNKALKSLEILAKKTGAFFVRIEPQNSDLKLPNHAKKSHDLNPKDTWLLDLTGKDEDLKARLPSRLLRYYNASAKKGITIETSHDPADIRYLLELQTTLAHEKGINTFSKKYLQTELNQPFATLYLLKYGEEIIAAGLVFDGGTTRYNLQGAQSEQGRKLHATGILTIQLILDAKKKGLKNFDFWGIAPAGAPKDHPWAGFTAFKKTFAGREINYLGTYDLVLNPAKYNLYRFLRRLHRLIK